MVFNINKILLFFSFLPFFLFNSIIFIAIPLMVSLIYFIRKNNFTIFLHFMIFLLITVAYFFRDAIEGYLNFHNIKFFFFFYFIICSYCFAKDLRENDLIFLLKIFCFFSIFNFSILMFQFFLPEFPFWVLMSESDMHYSALLSGRPFGLSGNPTHSGYLTLLATIFLIGLRAKNIFIFISILSLIIIINKMVLIIFLTLGVLFYLSLIKSYIKKFFLFVFSLIFSFSIILFFIFPYLDRWSESDFDVHTINHRKGIYEMIADETKNGNFLFFGNADFYNKLTKQVEAFDSLPALIFIGYGFFGLFLVYLFPLFLIKKNQYNFLIYLIFFIPSATMMAFYNTIYMFAIFLAFFVLCRIDYVQK